MNVHQMNEIQSFFRGSIKYNEPLKKHTTLKIGGPADYFFEPADKEDLIQLVIYHHERHLPYFILGRGSNILVSDKGIRGSVIAVRDTLSYIHVDGEYITVGAGYNLPRLVLDLIEMGFEGVENLGGIPGTVGGAVIMNAGAYQKEIFEVIRQVECIRAGKVLTLSPSQIEVRYRYTNLTDAVITEVTLQLKKSSNIEHIKQKRKTLLEKRGQTQPLNKPNAGSIFKNPPNDFAGRLIEACGLKGVQIGGAMVSPKHANFLINENNATAADMIALIDKVKTCVYQKFNILLELEVQLVGEGF
ncbi:MAG: UDP-N-acetylmuramate dehydrogenase [Bacteroidia bacterium]|nr:UDP-N-acetylmuramate dehydrogenase [Bacteroidia bacterium]MDW8345775.1 UDP-N-acetylmuramate dehydrogenase [Bacteroidia bacterium]